VMEAGRQLLAFGFKVKELKPLLRDVGDLSAGMKKPLEEVAGVFGRIKAGSFGEAFERLREFGVSRQDLEGAGLKFDKGGGYAGSVNEAMEAVRGVIQTKFGGSMEKLSSTTSGLLSTLRGKISGIMTEFGRPLNDAIKPLLTGAIERASTLQATFKNLRSHFSNLFGTEQVVKFKGGTVGKVSSKGVFDGAQDAVELAIHAGGVKGLNFLMKGFRATVAVFSEALGQGMAALLQPSFWSSLWHLFSALTNAIGGMLLNAFREPIALLQAGVEAAMAHLPKALGGYDEKAQAKDEMHDLIWKTIPQMARSRAAAEAKGDTVGRDRMQGKIDGANQQLADALKRSRGMTLEERKDSILARGPSVAGLSQQDFMAAANDEFGRFGASIKTTMSSGTLSAEEMGRVIKKALDGPDLLKLPAGDQKKLQAVREALQKAIPTEVKTAEIKTDAKPGDAAGVAGKTPKIEGDRLAKIGVFVGNGGPALDYARRTAEGIAKLVAQSAGLKSGAPGYAPVLAWGA